MVYNYMYISIKVYRTGKILIAETDGESIFVSLLYVCVYVWYACLLCMDVCMDINGCMCMSKM